MKTHRVFASNFTQGQQKALELLSKMLKEQIGADDLNIKPRLPDLHFSNYSDNYDGIYPFCTLTTDNKNWDSRIVILMTVPLTLDTMSDEERFDDEMLEQGVAVITSRANSLRIAEQLLFLPVNTLGMCYERPIKDALRVHFDSTSILLPISTLHLIEGGTLALEQSE